MTYLHAQAHILSLRSNQLIRPMNLIPHYPASMPHQRIIALTDSDRNDHCGKWIFLWFFFITIFTLYLIHILNKLLFMTTTRCFQCSRNLTHARKLLRLLGQPRLRWVRSTWAPEILHDSTVLLGAFKKNYDNYSIDALDLIKSTTVNLK